MKLPTPLPTYHTQTDTDTQKQARCIVNPVSPFLVASGIAVFASEEVELCDCKPSMVFSHKHTGNAAHTLSDYSNVSMT